MLVPRPISSRMTRLRSVALFRMFAVSSISTMKVLWPRGQVVVRADAREDAVHQADARRASAGTNEPICASSAISATWRR